MYIDRGEKSENEFVFDMLHDSKAAIEQVFGQPLGWERLDNKRACRIKAKLDGNVFDREEWESMINHMTNAMYRLEKAMKEQVKTVGIALKNQLPE